MPTPCHSSDQSPPGTDAGPPESTQRLSDAVEKGGSASDVGLHDAVLSGWFQNDSSELFRGLPIGSDDVVVDVGCGDGGSILFCARKGARAIAIDLDPDTLAKTKAKLDEIHPSRHETHVADASALPLPDAFATRIICTEVLEHVDDPQKVLNELFRIGRPGALYLLSVPDALQENMQKHVAPPLYFQKPNHIRIVEREQFSQWVEEAGLVVEQQTSYGFFWSIWWALFWACDVDLEHPSHPALDHWTAAWRAILNSPKGHALKDNLDQFMPKSQVIVARKP